MCTSGFTAHAYPVDMTMERENQQATDSQFKHLKLLSYNVQVGIPSRKYRHYVTNSWKHVLPFPERKSNLDNIAEFISDFDIVGLLELDAGSIRSEFLNQPEYVAAQAGFEHCYMRVNRDLGVLGQHSLALLSRHPAKFVKEHVLPSKIPGRGALEAHFDCGSGEPFVVILAHLSLLPGARHKQLSYISRIIQGYRHVAVMGDFNTTGESQEMNHLIENSMLTAPTNLKTFPSWKPKLAYDHILVTPDIKRGESEVYELGHSDHLPVSQNIAYPLCNAEDLFELAS